MSKKATTSEKKASRAKDQRSRRNAIVIVSLLGALSLTSALLLVMSTNPLMPDSARPLVAVQPGDPLFDTPVPFQSARWKYIFVHHSKIRRGNAEGLVQDEEGLGDHFFIGNGNGWEDGQIQVGQRWDEQRPAHVQGARLGDNCISICLIGDFDRSAPTAQQLRRLEQLVQSLQARCQIPASAVLLRDRPNSLAGVGRLFPTDSFRRHLLP